MPVNPRRASRIGLNLGSHQSLRHGRDGKAGDLLEVGDVVRHEGQSAENAGGGDEGVRQADRESTCSKLAHDLARAFGRSAIDGMSFQ
jgi:hypothetical protein